MNIFVSLIINRSDGISAPNFKCNFMSKKVVVVDDDDDILQIIKYVLEEQKIIVKAVNDIVSFQKISNWNPDLILLDDWLSDGRGGELCKAIKADKATASTPVILISAVNNLSEIAAMNEADDYIAKPFDIDLLLQKVNFYLEKKRKHIADLPRQIFTG